MICGERDRRAPGSGGVVVESRWALLVCCALGAHAWAQDMRVTARSTNPHPELGLIDLERTPSPAQIEATIVTSQRQAPAGCAGYVTEHPQLVLRTAHPVLLHFGVSSATDTVLVLQAADGHYVCDDDSGGSANPQLDALLGPGDHLVWIGTYGSGHDAAATLSLYATPSDA